ncbi:MAG: hypothetical protein U1F59_04130 [Candidatus Competibacteraceae bacterium]
MADPATIGGGDAGRRHGRRAVRGLGGRRSGQGIHAIGRTPDLFFWRSCIDGLEVDRIVLINGRLLPVEIKLTATPTLRHLELLENSCYWRATRPPNPHAGLSGGNSRNRCHMAIWPYLGNGLLPGCGSG